METIYALCPHCHKSNPVEDSERFEQNCIFCGQPFIVSQEKETKMISEPIQDQRNTIPKESNPNQLQDVNQTKPVNRNKTSSLR